MGLGGDARPSRLRKRRGAHRTTFAPRSAQKPFDRTRPVDSAPRRARRRTRSPARRTPVALQRARTRRDAQRRGGDGKTRLLAEFTSALSGGRARASQLENASQTHPGRSARFAKPWRRSCAKHRSHTSSPPRPSSAASQHWCPTHSKRSAPRSSRPTPWRKRTYLAACWVSSTCWLPRARWSSPSRTCTGPTRRRSSSWRWLARIGALRVLVVATYRDDEVHDGHPLFAILARLEPQAAGRTYRARAAGRPRDAGADFTRRWGLVIRWDQTTSARSSRAATATRSSPRSS